MIPTTTSPGRCPRCHGAGRRPFLGDPGNLLVTCAGCFGTGLDPLAPGAPPDRFFQHARTR